MPKCLVTGTAYLITVEKGDYVKYGVPFRVYATREKAERFMTRLRLHYSRKPTEISTEASELESDTWYAALMLWQEKHPGGANNWYTDLDEWAIVPMKLC